MKCSNVITHLLKRMTMIMASVIALAMIIPLIVPIPPLKGTLPLEQLADADSHFVTLESVSLHYKIRGESEPTFLLLHGFGASTYSWNAIMQPLGMLGTTIAYDRPAFGLTERPLTWKNENPYSTTAQPRIALSLLEHLGKEQAILVGHSAGGTLALHIALLHPERVQALILISPAVYTGGGAPPVFRPLLHTPQLRRIGPLIVRLFLLGGGASLLNNAWHDPTKITPEIQEGYTKPLRAENWDKALWEMAAATEYPDLTAQLGKLQVPVLIITGDDDHIVPLADSVRLANAIPGAELVVIPDAGHVAHEEAPQATIAAIEDFLTRLKQ